MKQLTILNAVSVALIAGCLGFTFIQKQQGGAAASIKRGSSIFTQYCLTCHQANGGGVPNLNPPLIKTKWVLGDKKVLIGVVLKGLSDEIEVNEDTYHNTMPPHNFLTDQQIADVLTYVRNSFGNKASTVTVAEVKSARAKLK